jgi:hypothetical protein
MRQSTSLTPRVACCDPALSDTLACPIHPPSERFKHASWWTIPRLVCRCAQYTGQCARGFVFDFNSQQTMESNERGNGLCRLYI